MMKKILVILVLSLMVISCNMGDPQSEDKNNSDTGFTEETDKQKKREPGFESTQHDFGKIDYGEEVGARFGFENQGETPLVINRVSTSCGCTVAEYTEEPVAPGESGFVEIIFDSRGKSGSQIQNARVYFKDMKKPVRLSVVAQVLKK